MRNQIRRRRNRSRNGYRSGHRPKCQTCVFFCGRVKDDATQHSAASVMTSEHSMPSETATEVTECAVAAVALPLAKDGGLSSSLGLSVDIDDDDRLTSTAGR